MNPTLLRIYHRLPPFARTAAASLHGLVLRRQRYGPETERWVAEAKEREHWNTEQWRAWRESQLARVLHRAVTSVPYYREQWKQRRRDGDTSSWERLENWPILEKETLRQSPRAFLADDCDPRRLYEDETSGTTGTPLPIWLSRHTLRHWYALFEARWRRWYGVSNRDRWAILGGKLVVPVERKKPPYWVWNSALQQLYLSTYHLGPEFIPYYLDALKRHKVRYLLGYTSSIYALASGALQLGRRDVKLKVVVTNAEPVYGFEKKVISEAFGCPVRETYGMVEMAAAASECEHGKLHLWPEAGWVEFIEGNQPVARGSVGDLVCTGLLNEDMPLIRYRVGDRGILPATEIRCECGRLLPVIDSIEGRLNDVLCTSDGRILSSNSVDIILGPDIAVRETQFIQEAPDEVRIRFVPAPGFTPEMGRDLGERLRQRMGPIRVQLEPVDLIPRGSNGKFRVVVCNLSVEQREALRRKGRQPACQ